MSLGAAAAKRGMAAGMASPYSDGPRQPLLQAEHAARPLERGVKAWAPSPRRVAVSVPLPPPPTRDAGCDRAASEPLAVAGSREVAAPWRATSAPPPPPTISSLREMLTPCDRVLQMIQEEISCWWLLSAWPASGMPANVAPRSRRVLALVAQMLSLLVAVLADRPDVAISEDAPVLILVFLLLLHPVRPVALDAFGAVWLVFWQLWGGAYAAQDFHSVVVAKCLSGLMLLALGGLHAAGLALVGLGYCLFFLLVLPSFEASSLFFTCMSFLLFSFSMDKAIAVSCTETRLLLAGLGGRQLSLDCSRGSPSIRGVEVGAKRLANISFMQPETSRAISELVSEQEHSLLETELLAFSEEGFAKAALRQLQCGTGAVASGGPPQSERFVIPFSSGTGRVRCLLRLAGVGRASSLPRLGPGQQTSSAMDAAASGTDQGVSGSIGAGIANASAPRGPPGRIARSSANESQREFREMGVQTFIIWENEGFKCLRCAKPPRPKPSSWGERARPKGTSGAGAPVTTKGPSGNVPLPAPTGGSRGSIGRGGDLRNLSEGSTGACILPNFDPTNFECCWMSLLNSLKHWNVPQSMPVPQRDCCTLHSWLFCARKILKYVQKHQQCINTLPYQGWQCQVCTAMNHECSIMCGVCWRSQNAPDGTDTAFGDAGALATQPMGDFRALSSTLPAAAASSPVPSTEMRPPTYDGSDATSDAGSASSLESNASSPSRLSRSEEEMKQIADERRSVRL